ncbi:hypothetical protein [Actinomadura bangladeshensis]|uniref:Uncharacterized protein n=1 Tax=Actinomadura bangladeshensis TaxID=453573 RepID=A0A4R4NS19_9ACTN|nr:hypothetical protein [Actinomadura bangladeshensis]TDC12431.1 hypothetical protein E1284_23405 [Actinomadura bangladeshensis]
MDAERDDRSVRLSSSLPPAGFTRAEPSPPRRRALRSPLLPVLALVLGAGLVLGIGYGTTRTAPVRTVTPDAATPSPSAAPPAPPPAPPQRRPERGGKASAAQAKQRTPRRAHPVRPPAHRPSARPHRPGPRPPAHRGPRKTRTARPASPSWIAAECRRRYPHDPLRRRACVAVLADRFGR